MLVQIASEVNAEVLGPLLRRSTMEIGVQVTNVDRVLEPKTATMDFSATDVTLIGRYGLTRNATLSCELYTGTDGVYRDSAYDRRYYTLGAGIQLLVWDGWGMRVSVGSHIKETFIFSKDGLACQEAHQSGSEVVLVEKSFEIFEQETTIWGGPGLFWYTITSLESANSFDCRGRERGSLNIWGYTLGVNLLLWDRLGIYSFVNYIDNLEPRAGLMYRF